MSAVCKLTFEKNPGEICIDLPGSKSYSNRALLISALAKGRSVLSNFSQSDDSATFLNAICALGIQNKLQANSLIIDGNLEHILQNKNPLTWNFGQAGTAMRFGLALAALRPGQTRLEGSERMHKRPIFPLVDALRELGAEIDYLGEKGCPPLSVKGIANQKTFELSVQAGLSSQYISALLMIAPCLPQGLKLKLSRQPVSQSYIEMTVCTMREFGAQIDTLADNIFEIRRDAYIARNYQIEPDASGASYFWGLAALSGKTIKVKNLSFSSLQGDTEFARLCQKMGAEVTESADGISVKGGEKLTSIKCNMQNLPDSAQTLAVLAAFAQGETLIEGLETLKIKETDRLQALASELSKCAINCQTGPAWIRIRGGSPKAARIKTYDDHRMAMAFSLMAAKCSGIEIEDPDVVGKSLPEFWELMQQAGLKKETAETPSFAQLKLVLIGFSGAGKTTVSEILSHYLQLPYFEMDNLILEESGAASISEIFDKQGESRFREFESEIARDLAAGKSAIISSGGGVVEIGANISVLKESGALFCFLESSFETICTRLQDDTARPLFRDRQSAAVLFKRRQEAYRAAADFVVCTENRSARQVAEAIVAKLRERI